MSNVGGIATISFKKKFDKNYHITLTNIEMSQEEKIKIANKMFILNIMIYIFYLCFQRFWWPQIVEQDLAIGGAHSHRQAVSVQLCDIFFIHLFQIK